MNECDAGAFFDVDTAGMDSVVNLPFDVSAWTRIQFWAQSLIGYPRDVKVIVQDDRTDAFGLASDAGGCNVCATFTPGALGYCGGSPACTSPRSFRPRESRKRSLRRGRTPSLR